MIMHWTAIYNPVVAAGAGLPSMLSFRSQTVPHGVGSVGTDVVTHISDDIALWVCVDLGLSGGAGDGGSAGL